MLNIATELNGSKQQRTQADTFYNGKDFAKKLRWLVTNPPKDSERWRITPEMASIMLQWNDRNRPASESTVKKYARLMRDGRWHYTGQTIIFSKERLIDGQHRLAACIAAETPIESLVVFGAPDEAFAFIDIGKTRTASNIFAIHGVKHYTIMSAAAQWVAGYEDDKVASAARGINTLDHDALYQFYLKHIGLQESAWVAFAFSKAKIVSPTMMVAIHYLCARKNRHEADEFFRKVADGIGFTGKRDPAYKLHKHLVDCAVAQTRPNRVTAAALTIKAWNAHRRGRDVGSLKFEAGETFPRII